MTIGKVRPLYVRPGARYACYGDGLCCTDIHAIGPITTKERATLALVSTDVVRKNQLLGEWVLTMGQSAGTCLFLDDERSCAIHEAMAGTLKPRGCHRFPFGLTATPRGGRVTLEFRCSCQTLMPLDAPPLEVAHAQAALRDGAGRLEATFRVGDRVRLAAGRRVEFERYETIEAKLLSRLESEKPEAVLEREPFEPIDADWLAIGRGMLVTPMNTRFDECLRHFGDAIVALRGERVQVDRRRPWSDSFSRAEGRMPAALDVDRLYALWITESLWRLHWAARLTFEQHRRSLATLLAIARRIESRLRRAGTRADRAAAEAITIVESVAASMWWEGVEERFSSTELK